MTRPLLLDLFCCAGGASTGYSNAGFDVVGVDIDPQPDYPYMFHMADAMEVLRALAEDGEWNADSITYKVGDFTAIHASPPCQGYTALKAVHGNEWPLLIEPVREMLDTIGLPYVIENVQGAPLRRDITLCGEMFGLGVIRHRYFELGYWTAMQPHHVPHRGRVAGWRHGEYFDGPYFAVYGLGGGKGSVKDWQDAMEMPWTSSRHHLAEAIPPRFTEYIGSKLMLELERAA